MTQLIKNYFPSELYEIFDLINDNLEVKNSYLGKDKNSLSSYSDIVPYRAFLKNTQPYSLPLKSFKNLKREISIKLLSRRLILHPDKSINTNLTIPKMVDKILENIFNDLVETNEIYFCQRSWLAFKTSATRRISYYC